VSVPKEIGHLVLNVSDVARSTAFYRDVVGFQVARYGPDGNRTFLTCGVMHHNLALFKAPAGAQPRQKGQRGEIGLNHFAFKVENYQALQQAHQRLVAANADVDRVVDHGMSLSVYFHDPDGIMMELFCDTFSSQAEGLAFMKATPGQAKPIDITAPAPTPPVIPQTDFSRAK
jgi:catechol-2,3-dioxygenase